MLIFLVLCLKGIWFDWDRRRGGKNDRNWGVPAAWFCRSHGWKYGGQDSWSCNWRGLAAWPQRGAVVARANNHERSSTVLPCVFFMIPKTIVMLLVWLTESWYLCRLCRRWQGNCWNIGFGGVAEDWRSLLFWLWWIPLHCWQIKGTDKIQSVSGDCLSLLTNQLLVITLIISLHLNKIHSFHWISTNCRFPQQSWNIYSYPILKFLMLLWFRKCAACHILPMWER